MRYLGPLISMGPLKSMNSSGLSPNGFIALYQSGRQPCPTFPCLLGEKGHGNDSERCCPRAKAGPTIRWGEASCLPCGFCQQWRSGTRISTNFQQDLTKILRDLTGNLVVVAGWVGPLKGCWPGGFQHPRRLLHPTSWLGRAWKGGCLSSIGS